MLTKKCPKCGKEKELTEFSLDRKDKLTGRQHCCKVCANKAAKKDYRENNRKDVFRQRANDRKRKLKELVDWIKGYNKCAFCGEDAACCLDFHHLDPKQKDFTVSLLVTKKSGIKALKEIKKCVVVCSNCHRKIHAGMINANETQLCVIPDFILDIDSVERLLQEKITSRKFCPHCGKEIWLKSKICKNCHSQIQQERIQESKCMWCGVETNGETCCEPCGMKSRRKTPQPTKITWPSKEELEKMLWEFPTVIIARNLGVSDKAVEKRAKSYGLSKPPRGYWAKQSKETSP